MIKKIDGYFLPSSVNHKYIVKVRPFLSPKTVEMFGYIIPTQRYFNPDVSILHVGINDLSSNKSPELVHGNKKYFPEIKESHLIKRNQPVLNKNISSAMLHLFDTV